MVHNELHTSGVPKMKKRSSQKSNKSPTLVRLRSTEHSDDTALSNLSTPRSTRNKQKAHQRTMSKYKPRAPPLTKKTKTSPMLPDIEELNALPDHMANMDLQEVAAPKMGTKMQRQTMSLDDVNMSTDSSPTPPMLQVQSTPPPDRYQTYGAGHFSQNQQNNINHVQNVQENNNPVNINVFVSSSPHLSSHNTLSNMAPQHQGYGHQSHSHTSTHSRFHSSPSVISDSSQSVSSQRNQEEFEWQEFILSLQGYLSMHIQYFSLIEQDVPFLYHSMPSDSHAMERSLIMQMKYWIERYGVTAMIAHEEVHRLKKDLIKVNEGTL